MGTPEEMIQKLNAEQIADAVNPKDIFHFKVAAFQAPEITEICWLLGTDENTNTNDFKEALYAQDKIMELKDTGPCIPFPTK